MARPVDWEPLADHDPVPGDTTAIREEARRMAEVGNTIREQVNRLRKIGKDSTLKGQYAGKLRTAANDLAGKLEKTAGRYTKVSGHLSTWARELDHAQAESVKALNMAKPAHQTLSRTYISGPPKKPEDMTPEERRAHQARKDAENAARAQLNAAKSKLREAIDHRDTHEEKVAKWIRSAIDDDVEDSWWDNVKDFVDRYANEIKIFIDIVSWVATALAIAAIFIPGLNVAVLLLVAGLIVVAGRSLLAAAGQASWMEVAIDSVGLLTMGLGRVGLSALRSGNSLVKAGALGARRGMVKSNLAATSAKRQALGKILSDPRASSAARRGARNQINALKKQARRSAPSGPQNLPKVSYGSRVLANGDAEVAALWGNVNRIAQRFPGVLNLGRAKLGYGLAQGAAWGGLGVDLADKSLGSSDAGKWIADNTPLDFLDKPSWESYNDFKSNTWQKPVGSTW